MSRRALILLRAINVGGHSPIPMAELRAALGQAGFQGVQTHLQTGNVLVQPGTKDLDLVAGSVERVIEGHFGLRVTAMARSHSEIADLLARNPFIDAGEDPKWVHTVFLEAAPDAGKVGSLDPGRSPSDRFVVSGREIFVHYPSGSGRSKLTLDYFERTLGTKGTARNWNTVEKLARLLDA